MEISFDQFLSKFPFNWFPLREGNLTLIRLVVGGLVDFHSIGFPCERGTRNRARHRDSARGISIQLVSPARGEHGYSPYPARGARYNFHSIGFPCERGTSIHHISQT